MGLRGQGVCTRLPPGFLPSSPCTAVLLALCPLGPCPIRPPLQLIHEAVFFRRDTICYPVFLANPPLQLVHAAVLVRLDGDLCDHGKQDDAEGCQHLGEEDGQVVLASLRCTENGHRVRGPVTQILAYWHTSLPAGAFCVLSSAPTTQRTRYLQPCAVRVHALTRFPAGASCVLSC